MQSESSNVELASRRGRLPNLLVALGLPVLLLIVGGRRSPRYLATVPSTGPAPQSDELSYYKNAYTIISLSPPELLADFPELQGLEPAASQQDLLTILSKVGATVEQLYQNFTSVAADERITQEQYGYDRRLKSTTHSECGYLIVVDHNGPVDTLEEYRTDARGKPVESTVIGQEFDSTNFASVWLVFYPDNQSGSHFRYVGQQTSASSNQYVIAFAERPGEAAVKCVLNAGGRSAILLYQGLAWIDAASFRIVRMRLDQLEPRLELGLESSSTDIQFGEVRIPQSAAALWLPRKVTVTSIYNGQMYRNQHQYFNFKLFNVKSEIKPAEPAPPDLPN